MKELDRIFLLKSGNKIILKQGVIEEQKGDVLLSWTGITLNTGSESFYKIHQKAGLQLGTSISLLSDYVKYGDSFVTIAGMLDFYKVVHCILPPNLLMFNTCFFNIIKTLITYKENNICRNLYLEFPIPHKKVIIENLFLYENQLKDFTFVFVAESFNDIEEAETVILEALQKKSFLKKIKKMFGL